MINSSGLRRVAGLPINIRFTCARQIEPALSDTPTDWLALIYYYFNQATCVHAQSTDMGEVPLLGLGG